MKKRLLTASDIRRLKDEGTSQVTIAKGDIITPLARDTARELDVEIGYEVDGAVSSSTGDARPTSSEAAATSPSSAPLASPGGDLEARVRDIVTAMVAKCHAPTPVTPVRHVVGRGLKLEPFPFDVGRPEMDIRLLDVVSAEHGSPIAGGLMSFREGSFPWTLDYDEIDYVIEGELHIGTDQGTVIGRPGDVLYIPKGTSITFGTPEWTKFFYVTFPAEWGG